MAVFHLNESNIMREAKMCYLFFFSKQNKEIPVIKTRESPVHVPPKECLVLIKVISE